MTKPNAHATADEQGSPAAQRRSANIGRFPANSDSFHC